MLNDPGGELVRSGGSRRGCAHPSCVCTAMRVCSPVPHSAVLAALEENCLAMLPAFGPVSFLKGPHFCFTTADAGLEGEKGF